MPMTKSSPHALRMARQHFVGEAHAVLEAAAVLVVAPVGDRRPELLDQRVVGRHQLAAVIAAGLGPRGAAREGGDDLRDLALGHRMAAVGIVHRGQAGGRPVVGQRVVPVAMRADVVELLDDMCALGMHRVGDAAEMRDDGIVVGAEVAARQHRGLVDRHRLHHDHRGPAHRALAVIAEMPLAGQPALAHVGGVRAEHDAVAQREVSQLQRLKDRRMIHRFLSQGRGDGSALRRRALARQRRATVSRAARAKRLTRATGRSLAL